MMNPYDRPIIVRPRAFWVRLVTATVPVALLYALFAVNYVKAVRAFSPSHPQQFVFALAYTAAFAGVASGVALALKRWAWETVYVIVGTLRLQGRQGVVIPAGTRFSSGENEFITTHENMIGASGFSDVEICTRWSQPYKKV